MLWGSLAAKFDMRLNTQSDGIWYALTRLEKFKIFRHPVINSGELCFGEKNREAIDYYHFSNSKHKVSVIQNFFVEIITTIFTSNPYIFTHHNFPLLPFSGVPAKSNK